MTVEYFHPGLRGVIAGETNISRIGDGLQYRGFCIHDLTEGANFLEVVYLLWHEELPSEEELADFRAVVAEAAELPEAISQLFDMLPVHASALESLRTGICLLSHFDPQPNDPVSDSGIAGACRLIAQLPLLMALYHRQRAGLPLLPPDHEATYTGNLYYMITGKHLSPRGEKALDAVLIACAEHEFNPSSYAARIAGSTHADIYSAVLAALSVLKGPGHGGGDDEILKILAEVGDPERASAWVKDAILKERSIPGFGGLIYTDCDPRASVLESHCAELAEGLKQTQTEEVADAIERAVWEELHLPPNVDWPMARLLGYLNWPAELHQSLFVCARLAGWCAHALEQSESGYVIRPRARYRGVEDRQFRPLYRR